jgi:hypothetical protein
MKMYWMYAINPDKTIINYKGDSGGMSVGITLDENKEFVFENNSRPKIGSAMRVGSVYARTMQYQDWWQTTPVAKIVREWKADDGSDNVVFVTQSGSTYHWKKFN